MPGLTRRTFLAAASLLASEDSSALLAQDRPNARFGSPTVQADSLVDHVGVCVHLSYLRTPYGDFDNLVRPRLLDAGIRHLRDGALTGGGYGPDHEYYRRMRALAEDGLKFSLVVPDQNFPSIAVPPEKLKDVFEWSGRSVAFFEGANEVNLLHNTTWPDITRRCQQAMYEAIKTDPDLSSVGVLGPALAGIGPSPVMLGDVSAYVDYANWHTYSGGRPPENLRGPGSLNEFLKAAEIVYPNRKMVITETGYHSALDIPAGKHPPTPEPIIARYIPRLLIWNFKAGIPRTYVYEFIDTHEPSTADAEANFGLIRHDETPKASYFALKNLLKLFSDSGPNFQPVNLAFTIVGADPDLQIVAFQKRNGVFLLATWLGVAAWDSTARVDLPSVTRSVQLAFDSPIYSIAYHRFADDGSVSREDVASTPKEVSLSVTDHLTIMEFRSA
jgi:hypothetical protein